MYTIITFLKDIVNYTGTLFPQVLEGLKVTMEIFLLTLILSIPLGVLVANSLYIFWTSKFEYCYR